jgi:hypothetical protein
VNYINIIKNSINKYIYLNNAVVGHHKAAEKDMFGCLNPTSKLDIENELKSNFYITYSQVIENTYQTIFKKKFYKLNLTFLFFNIVTCI